MHQFFIKSNQVWQSSIRIEGKDVNHIKNVLRMQSGDQLMVTDENEVEYLCEIGRIDADAVWLKLLKKEEISRELPSELYLFQCLPKGDKMDLIIEKAVELGVHTVIPVESRRCVVKLDAKKAPAKVKRWSAVAEAAAKQSKRSKIPHIHQVINFAEAIGLAKQYNLVCIPYENQKSMDTFKEFVSRVRPGLRIGVIIGPEGGFEPDEIQSAIDAGIRPVSLGNRTLRTETAGITMLSMLMLTLECGGKFGINMNNQPTPKIEETPEPVAETVDEDDIEVEQEEVAPAEEPVAEEAVPEAEEPVASVPVTPVPVAEEVTPTPVVEAAASTPVAPVPVAPTPVAEAAAPTPVTPVPVAPTPVAEAAAPTPVTPVPVAPTPVAEAAAPTPVAPVPVAPTPVAEAAAPTPVAPTPTPSRMKFVDSLIMRKTNN